MAYYPLPCLQTCLLLGFAPAKQLAQVQGDSLGIGQYHEVKPVFVQLYTIVEREVQALGRVEMVEEAPDLS